MNIDLITHVIDEQSALSFSDDLTFLRKAILGISTSDLSMHDAYFLCLGARSALLTFRSKWRIHHAELYALLGRLMDDITPFAPAFSRGESTMIHTKWVYDPVALSAAELAYSVRCRHLHPTCLCEALDVVSSPNSTSQQVKDAYHFFLGLHSMESCLVYMPPEMVRIIIALPRVLYEAAKRL